MREICKATMGRSNVIDAFVAAPRFVEFCGQLGVDLRPGQAELCRVAFDGAQPVDRSIAHELFGAVDSVPMGARSTVAAVCGARAGKSYLLVALRLVWGMLVRDLRSVAPGQRAVALIIAPNDKLRREVLNYARGAVRSHRALEALVCEDTADGFGLRRPDKHVVRFETGVATAGGYGARGRSLTDFALDECAFFRDSTFKVNDQEIYRAGSARVLPGGQTLVVSTPWATSGLLYELYQRNWGAPKDALVARAPTLALNDSELTRALVARARAQDPDNARREFDAEFMTSGTSVFFEGSSIERATVDEPFTLQPGDEVAAGGDLAFRGDSSALVIVARRGETIHVYDGLECRPTDEGPLSLERTFEAFTERLAANRCGYVLADHHYRDAMAEALSRHDIAVAPAQGQPAERYVRARVLLRSGRVRIHGLEFRERLLKQLREVHGKPTSGGGMSIQHPRWATGGHGDLADALVLALWQVGGDVIPAQAPAVGTAESERAAQADRRQHYLSDKAEQNRNWRSKYGLRE